MKINSAITPQTLSTKLTRIAYGFFMLIVLSTYTANLATTLVTTPVTLYKVANIDEAASKKMSVCAFSAAAITTLATFYPTINVVKIATTDAAVCVQALIQGQCDAAALFQSDWDAVVNKQAGNTGCVLSKVGRPAMPFNGGWAYDQDLAANCTSGMEASISSLLINYQSSGSFANQYAIDLSTYWDESCSTKRVEAAAQPIVIYVLSGPFVIYGATLVFAFICSIVSGFWTSNLKNGRVGWRAIPIVGTAGMLCVGVKEGDGCVCVRRGGGGDKDGVDADGKPVVASARWCGCCASSSSSSSGTAAGTPATAVGDQALATDPTDKVDGVAAPLLTSTASPQDPLATDVRGWDGTFVVRTRNDEL
jgi:hypothetical protein